MQTETGLHITVEKIPYKFNPGLTKKIIFYTVIILLCVLTLTFMSSKMAGYINIGNGVTIELDDAVKLINELYDGMYYDDRVSIKTDCNIYAPDTTRIMVEWENNSDETICIGDGWNLFKKDGAEFVPMPRISGNRYASYFSPLNFSVAVGRTKTYGYLTECFTGKLTPGIYKIKTFFYAGVDIDNITNLSKFNFDKHDTYVVETEFEVTNDKSKWDKSAYNFLNGENYEKYFDVTKYNYGQINSLFGYYLTLFRLYQNKETFDVVLTDGVYEYDLGRCSGKWGIMESFTYEADDKLYLVYSCSRDNEAGEQCSCVCVLDITDYSDVKEVFNYKFVADGDYYIRFFNDYRYADDGVLVIDNKFGVTSTKAEFFKSGSWYFIENPHTTGWLIYENGEFSYERNTEFK